MGIGTFTASVFTQYLNILEKVRSPGRISQRSLNYITCNVMLPFLCDSMYDPSPNSFLQFGWSPNTCTEMCNEHFTQHCAQL